MYQARLDNAMPVAVKMLKPDFIKDKTQEERDKIIRAFVNEVLAAVMCISSSLSCSLHSQFSRVYLLYTSLTAFAETGYPILLL